MDIKFFSQQFRMDLVEILVIIFYGSEDPVIQKLVKKLKNDFPGINHSRFRFPPPIGSYEELLEEEYVKGHY